MNLRTLTRRRRGTLPDDRPTVTFDFEGETFEGRRGQSLAAALHAGGVDTLTRSFKLHRPRGYTCGTDACPDCPLTVDGLPGVSSCVTPLRGGEKVRRERGWPTADHDLLAATSLFPRFVGAGFQFRRFAHHAKLARLAERVMAMAAGAGRLPVTDAAERSRARRTVRRTADVVVIGGGMSGCAAAVASARAGAHTVLVQRDVLGGRSRYRPEAAADSHVLDAVADTPNLELVNGTAVGRFTDGVVPVAAEVLYEYTAPAVVVATGSYDVPCAFPGNDKPGVMLASGARRLLHLERVRPGRRAVVVTEGSDGDRLANELRSAGVAVAGVVTADTVLGAVGWRRVGAVHVVSGGTRRRIRCDVVCVAVGERPADELVLQSRYLAAGSPPEVITSQSPASAPDGRLTDNTWVVGSAAGWRDSDIDAATRLGGQAAAHRLR